MTSQDFRTITQHAGHTRRFLIYERGPYGELVEVENLELPQDMTFAAWRGTGEHPLDDVDVLISRSFGPAFGERMADRGILAVATTRTDPLDAIHAFFEAGGVETFATRQKS